MASGIATLILTKNKLLISKLIYLISSKYKKLPYLQTQGIGETWLNF